MKKVTSLTLHKTSEGERVSITYVKINDDGKVMGDNIREDFVLVEGVNEDALNYYRGLFQFAQNKINLL